MFVGLIIINKEAFTLCLALLSCLKVQRAITRFGLPNVGQGLGLTEPKSFIRTSATFPSQTGSDCLAGLQHHISAPDSQVASSKQGRNQL